MPLGPDPLLPDLLKFIYPLATNTLPWSTSEKSGTIGTKMHETALLRNRLVIVGVESSGILECNRKSTNIAAVF